MVDIVKKIGVSKFEEAMEEVIKGTTGYKLGLALGLDRRAANTVFARCTKVLEAGFEFMEEIGKYMAARDAEAIDAKFRNENSKARCKRAYPEDATLDKPNHRVENLLKKARAVINSEIFNEYKQSAGATAALSTIYQAVGGGKSVEAAKLATEAAETVEPAKKITEGVKTKNKEIQEFLAGFDLSEEASEKYEAREAAKTRAYELAKETSEKPGMDMWYAEKDRTEDPMIPRGDQFVFLTDREIFDIMSAPLEKRETLTKMFISDNLSRKADKAAEIKKEAEAIEIKPVAEGVGLGMLGTPSNLAKLEKCSAIKFAPGAEQQIAEDLLDGYLDNLEGDTEELAKALAQEIDKRCPGRFEELSPTAPEVIRVSKSKVGKYLALDQIAIVMAGDPTTEDRVQSIGVFLQLNSQVPSLGPTPEKPIEPGAEQQRFDFSIDDELKEQKLKHDIVKEQLMSSVPGEAVDNISQILNINKTVTKRLIKELCREDPDLDCINQAITATAKALKAKQRAQDDKRITSKVLRVVNREDSAHDVLLESLNEQLGSYTFGTPELTPDPDEDTPTGIIQLSDIHLQEVILATDVGAYNEYNRDIACKRLWLYINIAKHQFRAAGVRKVVVACTGDLLNSNRRLDEMATNGTTISAAIITMCDILQQVLLDLAEDFQVSVVTVGGNESRCSENLSTNNKLMGSNHDLTVHYMLSRMLADTYITFEPIIDAFETLVQIGDLNIIVTHGTAIPAKDPARGVAKIINKWAKNGIIVDYVMCGHVHDPVCGSNFSRSGSLCGGNSYSENALLLRAPASQSYSIVSGKAVDTTVVNLQDVSKCQGTYTYDDTLDIGSDRKSVTKLNRETGQPYFSIVI